MVARNCDIKNPDTYTSYAFLKYEQFKCRDRAEKHYNSVRGVSVDKQASYDTQILDTAS